MSIRSELKPYQVITDGNMASSLTSLVTIIQKISLVSYTISWTGSSPSGTVSMQVSNDYEIGPTGNVVDAGNWSLLSFYNHGSVTPVTTVTISGASGTDNLISSLCGAYAVRLIYTRSSGTGTLQAHICGKVA